MDKDTLTKQTPSVSLTLSPRRSLFGVIVGAVMFLSVIAWSFAARSLLAEGGRKHNRDAVEQAARLFDYRVTQMQDKLRSQCGLMGEDPRLRSALATPGIDEATIVDILSDLVKLTGVKVLLVLTPAGRVESVVGNEAFRGLDLSTTKIVRDARDSKTPVAGSWAFGQELLDVGAVAIRLGEQPVAYLVLGDPIDARALDGIFEATGTGMGVFVSSKLASFAPADSDVRHGLERAAESVTSGTVEFEERGRTFLARVRPIEGTLPPSYVVWLRASEETIPGYEMLGQLLWVPVLVAFALSLLLGARSFAR